MDSTKIEQFNALASEHNARVAEAQAKKQNAELKLQFELENFNKTYKTNITDIQDLLELYVKTEKELEADYNASVIAFNTAKEVKVEVPSLEKRLAEVRANMVSEGIVPVGDTIDATALDELKNEAIANDSVKTVKFNEIAEKLPKQVTKEPVKEVVKEAPPKEAVLEAVIAAAASVSPAPMTFEEEEIEEEEMFIAAVEEPSTSETIISTIEEDTVEIVDDEPIVNIFKNFKL